MLEYNKDMPSLSRKSRGQSLIELLVAIGIGVVLVVAAVGGIVPALLLNQQTTPMQVGTALGMELMNRVRVWSEGDWHAVLSIATGSANMYTITSSTSPFSAVGVTSTMGEVLQIGTSTYRRYFYVSDVDRMSGSEGMVSYDPSTKLVTVVYQLPSGATSSLTEYLTRHGQNLYRQMDWSGGPGVDGPATTTDDRFATSVNISYATTTGSIYVKIPGY